MLNQKDNQLSIYAVLYSKIPENHTLKRITEAVDFSFINKLLEKSYCTYYGRPAKEPELMVKLLVLQYLYNLSDVRVIEEASLNLAYMYFLGINPEDDLPHPSLLAKFRTHRLQETSLDDIITGIIQQCVEKGIIKDTGIAIDTTHTEANTFKCTPERLMKRLAKKIVQTVEIENGEIPESINREIPDYQEIENHEEAKATMKTYLEDTITQIETTVDLEKMPKTKAAIDNAKDIINHPKFMKQKATRSLVDQDARVGRKSKTSSFFGYKTEYMMTTDERLITSVHVEDGSYVDGTVFDKLLELTKKSGLSVQEVYGDKAYFRKSILDAIHAAEAKPFIPVSEMAYRINEDKFTYNKDSDEWHCEQGNHTIKKHHRKSMGKESYLYCFNEEICRECPIREDCIKGSGKGKILHVGINTPQFYQYSQEQKTDEFKEKYKKRASIEWKNGEMKHYHGLNRARGYGLLSMSRQAKLTALAVNLKRIAGILSSKQPCDPHIFIIILKITAKSGPIEKICG